MKAAVLREARQPMTIEDVTLDKPGPHELRIRVAASGLCHSDYHFMVGDLPCPMPAVMGHEASGIVEAVGENVHQFKPGDRVVTCLSSFCGECGECQTGHTHICGDKPNRPFLPCVSRMSMGSQPIFQFSGLGAFAEEMLVHKHAVTKLPEGMPLDVAALLGCGVITGVGAVTNRAKVRIGQTVEVIGCGGVGLNVIQGARLSGASRIIAIDTNPAKLALAKHFGATDVVLGGADAVEQVHDLTGGGVDFAFEVIGLPVTARQALMMCRKAGAAVLVGVHKSGTELSFPASALFQRELQVMTSTMGSSPFQVLIPQLAQLYLSGQLMLDELVSQRIALADINRGYEQMVAGEVARSIITFDGVGG